MNTITDEVIKRFELYLYEEERSNNTIEKYMRDVCFFREWLQDRSIDKSVVIEYKKRVVRKVCDEKREFDVKYDNLLLADIPQNTPKRFYTIKTNEYMINNSDFLICYVQRSWGGAIKTYKYAKRKNLQIYNIAEKPIS